MTAAYVKGNRRIVGKNQTRVPGHAKHEIYPDFCGRHAELHVYLQAKKSGVKMKRGTLYVAGVNLNRKRTTMANTRPCEFCRELLERHTDIRFIVYIKDGVYIKEEV